MTPYIRNKRVLPALCLMIGLCLGLATDSLAAQDPRLTRGIDAYWNADYVAARETLETLDENELSTADRLERQKFLGLCLWAEGKQELAGERFVDLLRLDPGYRLNRSEVAPPLLSLFETALDRALAESYDRGAKLYDQGRFAEAQQLFRAAQSIDPASEFSRVFIKLAEQQKP